MVGKASKNWGKELRGKALEKSMAVLYPVS